jgi:hypothetical protein
MERTQRWHRGRWLHRGQEARQCETCGLDLPRGASSQMRRHGHCRSQAHRARGGASRPASARCATDAANAPQNAKGWCP